MTTVPLKEPFRLRATLFQGNRLLASVRCRLSPPSAPVSGMAIVTDDRDWLTLGPLRLVVQRTGQTYQVTPTKIEQAAGVPSLLWFGVSP
jgi:hypothetical protein